MRISSIIREIEKFAPLHLQEDFDNSGLQVGDASAECTGVLLCFDVTPSVIDEAKKLGCNLVVSHHPLFFKGVKRLTGDTPQQLSAMKALAAGICIYSSHTASDSTPGGVSYTLAKMLGIKPLRVIDPLAGRMVQLRVYVPRSHAEVVRLALFDAGAGAIGDYDSCSFTTEGTGTFRPLEGADPFSGEVGEVTDDADEVAIDVVLPTHLVGRVEQALLEVHPYETPAYVFTSTLNRLNGVGLGVYGVIDDEINAMELIDRLKKATGAPMVRTTRLPDPEVKIRRVALCGGAGGEYIGTALAMGAQAYITADVKYHDFVDYQDRILLIDGGHYDTEAAIKEVLARVITEKFGSMVPVHLTKLNDNPINFI